MAVALCPAPPISAAVFLFPRRSSLFIRQGIQHLVPLLQLTLNGIDVNDVFKTQVIALLRGGLDRWALVYFFIFIL